MSRLRSQPINFGLRKAFDELVHVNGEISGRNGKTGQMPAFGSTFSDEDIKAIIRYIRELKDD